MRAIFVDDEQSAHTNFRYDAKGRAELKSVEYFYDIETALEFAKANPVDCAFLDILMPGMGGLDMAKALKDIHPHVEVVFISAYDEYAREAYKVGAKAYLPKPYTEAELTSTLTMLKKLTAEHIAEDEEEAVVLPPRIYAKTFGDFDLLVNGQPVQFQTAKAKELLAFLIDRRGSTATNAQVFLALWERQEYSSTTSTYVRRTIRSLKTQLKEQGVDHILVTSRNCTNVDTSQFYCDYYELMKGNRAVAKEYNGAYMNQYSWSETTVPLIERTFLSMMNMDNDSPFNR